MEVCKDRPEADCFGSVREGRRGEVCYVVGVAAHEAEGFQSRLWVVHGNGESSVPRHLCEHSHALSGGI
jgi:hypothetical protein